MIFVLIVLDEKNKRGNSVVEITKRSSLQAF